MMHEEFERIAGYEVTFADYAEFIEPMYMAVCDAVSKEEFVKMVDKKRFALPNPAAYLRQVRKEARHLFLLCGHAVDYDSERRMKEAADKYAERKFGMDLAADEKAYMYFEVGYEYPELKKGCTYPKELVIGRNGHELERVKLQRN